MFLYSLTWSKQRSGGKVVYHGVFLANNEQSKDRFLRRECGEFAAMTAYRVGHHVPIRDGLPAGHPGWLRWVCCPNPSRSERKQFNSRLLQPTNKGMRFFCFQRFDRNQTFRCSVVVHETRDKALQLLQREVMLSGDMDRYNEYLACTAPFSPVSVYVDEEKEFGLPGVLSF